MLQAYVSFNGTNGKLLNYLSNFKSIQDVVISRTDVGKYTVTFLTKNKIDATKIYSSIINVTCQSPSGTTTATNVVAGSITSIFNQLANVYSFQVTFKIELMNIATTLLTILPPLAISSPVDRSIVMFSINAKNDNDADSSASYAESEEGTFTANANMAKKRDLNRANQRRKAPS